MFVNPLLSAALDRIAERADDLRRAFLPGAASANDDVAKKPSAQFTLDGLSVASPENAYFVVARQDGTQAYTRDGSFAVRDGVLTAGGHPVLGRTDSSGALEPLRIDPVDAALGRVTNLRLDSDGALRYSRAVIDPRTGQRQSQDVTAGRVGLARFPAATKLEGDGWSCTPPARVVPHTGLPGSDGFASLHPMQRSAGGVDLDASLARLKDAYVAFDALAAAEAAKDRFGKNAMDVLK